MIQEQKFNTTKIIEETYNEGRKLSPSMLSLIDFSEISEKTIKNKKEGFYKHTETLSSNCMMNLPLEAYKDYITKDWVNNKNIIYLALNKKKHDFVEHLLEISSNYVKEQNVSSDYFIQYEKNILEPILNINRNLTQNKDSKNEYLEVFDKTLTYFDTYFKQKSMLMFKKEPTNDLTLWFKNYDYIKAFFTGFVTKEDLFYMIIKDKQLYPLYLEIFKQDKDYVLSDLSCLNNGIEPLHFKKAFEAGNKKVIKHLFKVLKLSSNDAIKIFDSILNKWVVEERKKIVNNDSDKYSNLLENSTYIKNLIETIRELIPNYNISKWDMASHVLSLKNMEYISDFIKENSQIKTEQLFEGLNASEWNHLYTIYTDFMQKYSLSLETSKKESSCYQLFFASKVNQFSTELECHNNISEDRINAIYKVLETTILHYVIAQDEVKAAILLEYKLDKKLTVKENEKKKHKI